MLKNEFAERKNRWKSIFLALKKTLGMTDGMVSRMSQNEAKTKKDILNAFVTKNTSGVVVESFLSKQECMELISKLDSLSEELITTTPFGVIYGETLVGSSNQMPKYFLQSNLLNEQIISVLNFDFLQKIQSLFNGVKAIKPAKFEEGNYAMGTFRSFEPNGGGLHAHAEAEFISYLAEFEGIRKNTDVETTFNYLLILETAELGGELELYDLYWQNSPELLKGKYEFRDHYKFREPILQQYKRRKIALQPGDLLLFNGVNMWHGVSEIRGKRSRKTFAGFIAKSAGSDDYVIYN